MSGKITANEKQGDSAVKAILDGSLNTSQKIRALHALELDRSTIANLLNKRYQHVRNVLITPVKG
jgi:hypothetical protein